MCCVNPRWPYLSLSLCIPLASNLLTCHLAVSAPFPPRGCAATCAGAAKVAPRFDPSEWGRRRREAAQKAAEDRIRRKAEEAAAAERAAIEAEELERLRERGYARVDVGVVGGAGAGDGGTPSTSASPAPTPSSHPPPRGGGGGGGGKGRKGAPAGFLARMQKHEQDMRAKRAVAPSSADSVSSKGSKGKRAKKKKQSVLQKVQAIQAKRDARRKQQKAEVKARERAMRRHGGDMDKAHYCQLIESYRRKLGPPPHRQATVRLSARLSVCVRKRPMNDAEQASPSKFDVMTVKDSGCLVVHEPKVKLDLAKGIDNHDVRPVLQRTCAGVGADTVAACSSTSTLSSESVRAMNTSTPPRCKGLSLASLRRVAP